MTCIIYRFGELQLDPAARELRRGGSLILLPRRILDALIYLIEHRERAVGRDELIGALWGRLGVADVQVSQLIMRLRQAIGDDSHRQHAIRTIPGFGYRWVMTTQTLPALQSASDVRSSDALQIAARQTELAQEHVDGRIAMRATGDTPIRRWGHGAALTMLCIVLAASGPLHAPQDAHGQSAGLLREKTLPALAVLPVEIAASSSAQWVRLGAMDLIAGRLRSGGLVVTPSESVVAALHASPTSGRDGMRLQRILGAGLIVQGTAIASRRLWRVQLRTRDFDGIYHQVESNQPDVTVAARQAADLLLASLGRKPPADTRETPDRIVNYVQMTRAALLAGELDTARAILIEGSAVVRDDPRLRALQAQLDFRTGRLEQTRAALMAIDADPNVVAMPLVHGQMLTTLGFIDIRRERCESAERHFDKAVRVLHDQRHARETGVALAARGLARACLHRFDAALDDLARAGPTLQAAGDRLGIARVNNYLGQLELARGRPSEAALYFTAAAATNESFGNVESLRANLSALFVAQARLLRWQDALATSERLWRLRGRIEDPALQFAIGGFRARALIAQGRLREAGSVLAATHSAWPQAQGESSRYLHEADAEFAWRNGQPQQTRVAARKVLQLSPRADGDRARALLLLQRASIAAGEPTRTDAQSASVTTAEESPGNQEATRGGATSALLVAQAEWAAHQRRDADAERGFRLAQRMADDHGVAADIALVAGAYSRWLLMHTRIEEATSVAGRVVPLADRDFDSALLLLEVFHAAGKRDAWASAMRQAQRLAGERSIPRALLLPPRDPDLFPAVIVDVRS